MITPALLILASGSLLSTVLARLARVVENVRKIGAALPQADPSRVSFSRETLALLERRASLAEASITAYFLAVTLFVLTCLLIAVDRFVGHAIYWLPVGTAVAGVFLLLVGSGCMLGECRVAVRQIKREIASVWQDLAPKTT